MFRTGVCCLFLLSPSAMAQYVAKPPEFAVKGYVVTPAGWDLIVGSPRPITVEVDHSVFASGKHSASIAAEGSSDTGFGTLIQATDATDYREKRVRFSGDLKTQEVKNWAGLWFRVVDARRKTLVFDNMQKKERRMPGDSDWRRHDIVVDVPASAKYILYGFILSGTGKLWADELRIEVVDQSIPVTSDSSAPNVGWLSLPSNPPSSPRNLDFEGLSPNKP
jgi:hypothetical protein